MQYALRINEQWVIGWVFQLGQPSAPSLCPIPLLRFDTTEEAILWMIDHLAFFRAELWSLDLIGRPEDQFGAAYVKKELIKTIGE